MANLNPRKAVALISGGLDSMLAAKLMIDQGIHVEGINFYTGFCVEGHTQAIRNKDKPKRNNSLWVAEQLGIPLHIVDVSQTYKDVVLNPKYGYGANMNPCLDCKIFMVKQAKKWIDENNFDFIITGEVMGQRPMSQRKNTFPVVSEKSGAEDLLLRPLCAQNLEPTLPEREKWVDRDQLLNITGRSRKAQMELAEKFAFSDYAQPAGGCCFLTDPNYTKKLKDLWSARGEKRYELDDIILLKVGRHFRIQPYFKLILARDEGENNYLSGYRRQYASIECLDYNGPIGLIEGDLSLLTQKDFEQISQLVGRYTKGKNEKNITCEITIPEKISKSNPKSNSQSMEKLNYTVSPFLANQYPKEWLL